MSAKLFVFSCLFSLAFAGYIQYEQPAIIKKVIQAEEPANYEFNYNVHDDHTGDIKQQHESAKNGAISGFYTLNDADGYKRIVHYTADDHNGFQAKVEREPVQGYKVAQPVVVKKIIAQPAIAIQKYVAPVQQYYHSEPQYHYQPAPVKVAKIESHDDAYTHVSFNGPSSNYHY